MQWMNKENQGGIPFSGKTLTFEAKGIDMSSLRPLESGKDFLKIRLTSVLDVTDDYDEKEGELFHRITADGKEIGTIHDSVCQGGGGHKRDFALTLPLSFYFENKTDLEIIPVTPRRLYEDGGAVIFQMPEGESPRYLLFKGINCILHFEGKQLLVTAKAGEAKWRFRFSDDLDLLKEHGSNDCCKK